MGPLSLGIIVSILLFVFRWAITADGFYIFLPYNLALALIPLVISRLLTRYMQRNHPSWILAGFSGFVWLLFIPNAPYIMTDFIHLGKVGGIPLWFDALFILLYASTGLLAGWYSLYDMQKLVKKWYGKFIGWVFVCSVLLLTSFGVYLGRFLRWNSWDLFLDPLRLINDVLVRVNSPTMHVRLWIVTGGLLGFFLISYASVYRFFSHNKD